MLLILLEYHGEVGIEPWEYMLGVLYIMAMYLYFGRKKKMNIKLHHEYKYFIAGFVAKMIGAAFFALIYFYYYKNGDTISYFYSGVAMNKMLLIDPIEYFREVFLGDNSARALSQYSAQSILPWTYVFTDGRTFQAVRASALLSTLTFNSYLLSSLIMATFSFAGIWACYRTFVSYFPQLAGQLAIGFLFMPSAIFWGSGIMKDTFTFSAACGWVYAVDEVFFKRRNVVSRTVLIVFCAAVMIKIKPYIFMVLLPATLLWLLYMRVVRLRNILVRFVLIPMLALVLVSLSIFILSRMGDMFDKFALDDALSNIQNIQGDLSSNDAYGNNKFNIGEFDGTWTGVLGKFPIATNAALFRPYLWETRKAVTALSGLENLFMLVLTIYVLAKAGVRFFFRAIASNPLLMMSMTFSLLFAFVVGITTPNFGALVRFKIPMLPFYVSSLFIILYLYREREQARRKGVHFDLAKYRMPQAAMAAGQQGHKAGNG